MLKAVSSTVTMKITIFAVLYAALFNFSIASISSLTMHEIQSSTSILPPQKNIFSRKKCLEDVKVSSGIV